MLDSFRSEFGDVAPWVRAIPRPCLPATRPFVAAASAIGAFWLTSSLLGGVTLVLLFVQLPLVQVDEVTYRPLPVRETIGVLAMLVGAAVARASGGWRAVAIAASLFAATEVGAYLLQSARCTTLLSFPRELCPTPERLVAADVPRVLGAAVGLLVAPIVRTPPGRAPALLLAATLLPLSSLVVQLAITPFSPMRAADSNVGAVVLAPQLLLQGAQLAVWVAVGVVLGRLGGGTVALLLLGLTVVPAATFGLYQVVVIPTPDEFRLLQLVGLAANAAMVVGLVGGWRLARVRSSSAERDVPHPGTQPPADRGGST